MKNRQISKPVIYEMEDSWKGIARLTCDLDGKGRRRELLLEYPTMYIHNWKRSGKYEVYVGESNDVIRRTREHHEKALNGLEWQVRLKRHHAKMFIIGHEHFHLLLDCRPQFMISDMVKIMKGNLARRLFLDYPELKKQLWGGHLWNPSYCTVTVSNRSYEQVKHYMTLKRNHNEETEDE